MKLYSPFFQLFDEGHNLVSMNLPKAIEIMKKKELEEAKQNHVELPEELPVDLPEDVPISLPQVSDLVMDVEYEDDYVSNDLPFAAASTMVETHVTLNENKNKIQEVRDYSINLWNGSPGLSQWGYDEKYKEQ